MDMSTQKKMLLILIASFILLFLLLKGAIQEVPDGKRESKTGQTILSSVWVTVKSENQVCIAQDRKEKAYRYDAAGNGVKSGLCEVVLEDNHVIKITPLKMICAKVVSYDGEELVLEQNGKSITYPLDSDFQVFHLGGTEMVQRTDTMVYVGYSVTDFAIKEGTIMGAVVEKDIVPDQIRVLLRSDGYENLYHDKVTVTSEDSFTVCYGTEKKTYEAGKKVTIKKDDSRLKKERITIAADTDDGKIQVLSIKRGDGNPSYRGSLELSKGKEGIYLVNELALESYLYSVVPSEMPNSYGLEALKVQAVCARTYAYGQIQSDQYGKYGAHLDDSVAFQVYNNTPETKESIQAVDETCGQILTCEGKPISTYYFSTSCGHTASAKDVWMNQSEAEYLKGQLQTADESKEDKTKWGYAKTGVYDNLSKDSVFRRFLADESFCTYDSDFSWYRWRVSIAVSDLEQTINASIAVRYKENPELILTKNEKGDYVSKPIETIGTLKSISLGERAESGILTYVIIKGSKATVKVISEYNIRILFAPRYDEIYRQDNSTVKGMSILPSAFLILDKEKKNDKTYYLIQGGGYGHGVGMSQNGVLSMVKEGHSYKDILSHYYSGTEITSLLPITPADGTEQ